MPPITNGAYAVQLQHQPAQEPVRQVGTSEISAVITPIPRQASDNWRDLADCLNSPYEMFFPEKGQSTKEAKKICASCEVSEECLEYALENDGKFGIWGGTSQLERRRIKRQRARAQGPKGASRRTGRVADPAIAERDAEIRAARERNVSVEELAAKYGLSANTIYRISGPIRRTRKAEAQSAVAVTG